MFYYVVPRQPGGFLRLALRTLRTGPRQLVPSQDIAKVRGSTATNAVTPEHASLTHSLQTVTSSYELFEMVSLKRKDFSAEHVLQALRALFQLQKQENTAIQTKHILKNPDFEHLCRNLKSISRSLDVNETIEAIKILNFCGVPTNSEICMTLLHLVRNQINDISLSQIIFLEFLMKKFEPTPLVEAFRIALPMLMQIQLTNKMDHENSGQVTDLLQFASRNAMSEQSTMSIISALTMHGTDLSPDEARSIVWSLCDLEHYDVRYDKLMHNSLEVLCDSVDEMAFGMVETTLSKMVSRFGRQNDRNEAFYDEEFFKRCARYVVDKDMGLENAIYIQRKFNRINFVDVELIEYVAAKFARFPELLSSANQTILLTFVTSMSTAFYKPICWDGLKKHVLLNPILRSTKTEWPWLRFILELLVLDVTDHERLNTLCHPEFLLAQTKRGFYALDYLQILLLHQAIEILLPDYTGNRLEAHLVQKSIELQMQRQECPLKSMVEFAFGGVDNVYSQVQTKYGHYMDHLLVFDARGKVVPRTSGSSVPADGKQMMEDIPIGAGHKRVAIITYPKSHYCINQPRLKGMFQLRIKSLEALGVSVCVVNHAAWSLLLDREKLHFIEREVKYKL